MAQRLMWILWPGFVMACLAELVFFSVVDPQDLHFLGQPLELSRTAIYSFGFFYFLGAHVWDQRADMPAAALAVRDELLPLEAGSAAGRLSQA